MSSVSKADEMLPKKQCQTIQIAQDINGLVNYFTAKNIRFKVRHPIFLALKFPIAFKIFYNPKMVQSQDQQELTVEIQCDLMKFKKLKSKMDIASVTSEHPKYICFVDLYAPEDDAVESSQNAITRYEKVLQERKFLFNEKLKKLESVLLQVITERQQVPSGYKQLGNIQKISNGANEFQKIERFFKASMVPGSEEQVNQIILKQREIESDYEDKLTPSKRLRIKDYEQKLILSKNSSNKLEVEAKLMDYRISEIKKLNNRYSQIFNKTKLVSNGNDSKSDKQEKRKSNKSLKQQSLKDNSSTLLPLQQFNTSLRNLFTQKSHLQINHNPLNAELDKIKEDKKTDNF